MQHKPTQGIVESIKDSAAAKEPEQTTVEEVCAHFLNTVAAFNSSHLLAHHPLCADTRTIPTGPGQEQQQDYLPWWNPA